MFYYIIAHVVYSCQNFLISPTLPLKGSFSIIECTGYMDVASYLKHDANKYKKKYKSLAPKKPPYTTCNKLT